MISSQAESINALWANLLIEELLRHDINQFILSPGSRCAPLTAAIARRVEADKIVHFDERGAAFFALGYGKATGKPAVLVCTSGTATANYFPAIIEASMDPTPMIILTADRPPELHGIGANQTIDQHQLYGRFVRKEVQIPCPSEEIPAKDLIEMIDSAVRSADAEGEPGPVHLNCPFREPLAPSGPGLEFETYLAPLADWMKGTTPISPVQQCQTTLPESEITEIVKAISQSGEGIMVVGPLKGSTDISSVKQLVEKLGWPVFADIRSGLRIGSENRQIISHFDQLLLKEDIFAQKPLKILHIGGVMTSKRYYQFIEKANIAAYVHLSDNPENQDPSRRATGKIAGNIVSMCSQLEAILDVPRC